MKQPHWTLNLPSKRDIYKIKIKRKRLPNQQKRNLEKTKRRLNK